MVLALILWVTIQQLVRTGARGGRVPLEDREDRDGGARGAAHIPGAHRGCDSLPAALWCPCSWLQPPCQWDVGSWALWVSLWEGLPHFPGGWVVSLQSLTSNISGVCLSPLFNCLNCHPSGTAPHCLLRPRRPWPASPGNSEGHWEGT